MKRILWALAFLSLNAAAQPAQNLYRLFPVLECPRIGDEYEQMISKLEAVKTSIKQDANCKNVEMNVKNLEDLVTKDRDEVLEIAGRAENQSLGADDAEKVRAYAENITKKVTALNDLFMRSNHCFREDDAGKQLSTLSGFVSEAAQMVGSLSGPWGAPIALAGNVVAGFLTGMDQVLKSRAGYDFSKRDQWTSYVQNLCTYHGYREQIEHLLNPAARIAQLKVLKTKLDTQIDYFSNNCVECPDMMRLQSLGLRDWVVRELARVDKESRTYWADVSGRHILYRTKEELEDFLIAREAPRFLAYQVQRAVSDYYAFEGFAGLEGRAVYAQLEKMSPDILTRKVKYINWSETLDVFRSLMVSKLNFSAFPAGEQGDEGKYLWMHFRDQSLNHLRTAQTSAQVVQTFCSFFRNSGRYSPGIRGQCTSATFKRLLENQKQIEKELSEARAEAGSYILK